MMDAEVSLPAGGDGAATQAPPGAQLDSQRQSQPMRQGGGAAGGDSDEDLEDHKVPVSGTSVRAGHTEQQQGRGLG